MTDDLDPVALLAFHRPGDGEIASRYCTECSTVRTLPWVKWPCPTYNLAAALVEARAERDRYREALAMIANEDRFGPLSASVAWDALGYGRPTLDQERG